MIEIQQFGWNLVTLGFIGAMLTALLGFWGVIRQNQAIWRQCSGRSVSVVMFTYGTLFFAAGFVYGTTIGSIALMVMGVRALLQVPVLIGLWKFKGFKWWESVLSLLSLVAFGALIALPHKDVFYFVIAMGSIASFVPQPVEMLMNRSRGALTASFLWTTVIGVSFWSVYSISIGDWVLSIANPVFLLLVIATLIIWYVMPQDKPETGESDDD